MSLRTRVMRGLALAVLAGFAVLATGTGLIGAEGKKAAPAAKLDAAALAGTIDKIINARLAAEKIDPSGRADDAEFLRRVYLDLTGKIPTPKAAAEFLASTDANKRAKLIDELLASDDYGRHMADLWAALLLPKSSDNRRLNNEPFITWLAKSFNDNTSWDKLATELLTATGPQAENPAVTYFLANNTVDKQTDSVGKVFMGMQLQCAQCHNHPFTEWQQAQYWETAAFFMKVQLGNINQAAKNGTSPGVQEVANIRRGKNALPESAKVLPPKFLDGTKAVVGKAADPLRPVLAKWLCSAENPYFAKAMVNRSWGQMFGRGFINPLDDIRDENEPSHPALFTAMAEQFAANNFDVKYLLKAICLSETYQRTSKPNGSNRDVDPTLFARMNIKVLSPEQLYDSFQVALGIERAAGRPGRPAQANRPGQGGPRVAFVNFFNLDENWDPMEYQAGIPQALRLMNTGQTNNPARAVEITRDTKSPTEAVGKLYLTVLSRYPNEAELQRAEAYVKKVGDNRQAYADLLWALVNSSEFVLNR